MRFLNVLRENSGFTLVELMTAVGIVGGLSAIAVPNYLKHVAKAKQSEAKIALASLYVGEKQFAVQYGYYTSCLNRAGVNTPAGDRFYAFGFQDAQATALKCSAGGTTACNTVPIGSPLACSHGALAGGSSSTDANSYTTVYGATFKSGTSFPSDANFASAGPTQLTGVGIKAFSAAAVGSVSSGSSFDIWKINEQKQVININSGI